MFLVAAVAFLLLLWVCVPLRLILRHPFASSVYAARDTYFYFKHMEYNRCKTGDLVGYVSLTSKVFGNGKTLSAVNKVCTMYNRYNNTLVWDADRLNFVTQKVQIISNVHLKSVPYEQLVSLKQVVRAAENNRLYDEINDTLTITLVLGDEFGVQMNSRSFKDNIDPLFLNTLLTSRHHHISMYYTAQRPSLVDCLLRNVTSYYVACDKVWRFQLQNQYDSFEMENAQSPLLLKPLRRTGFLIFDADFAAYDTLACVQNLEKSCEKGDMLTEEQILSLRQNSSSDSDAILNPSRKFARQRQKFFKHK